MKLIIIKAVESYHQEILNLLKKAKVATFSEVQLTNYSNASDEEESFSWFQTAQEGFDAQMFISFANEKKTKALQELIKEFNQCSVENANFCVKMAVMPVEIFL